MITRLFIDIDGVLTASPQSHPDVSTFVVPTEEVEEGVVIIEADLVSVHEILAQFDEVVWATSWSLRPRTLEYLEALLELPGYPSVDLTEEGYTKHRGAGLSGKADSVMEYPVIGPVRSLWIDDEITPAESLSAALLGISTIVPSWADGGIYTCRNEIERWLSHHG